MTRPPDASIVLSSLVAALLLAACGGSEPAPRPPSGHAHSHEEGPNGGTLQVLGDHALHLETLHDEEAGRVVVWVSDADLAPVRLDSPPVLNLRASGGSVTVPGTPESEDESAWAFEHEALRGEPEGARFRLQVRGRTWTPDLE